MGGNCRTCFGQTPSGFSSCRMRFCFCFFILSYKGPYSLKAMVLTASPPSNTRNSMAPAKSLPLLKPQLPRLETKALDYVGVE